MRSAAPEVIGVFDKRTGSVQYVVICSVTKKCAIIDPVLDFDEKSGSVATDNADKLLELVEKRALSVEWILDTHPHADHLTAAYYLKQKTGAPIATSRHICRVQSLWKDIYNFCDLATDGSQWDVLLSPGETFSLGRLEGEVIFSPGHTLASSTYVIGGAAFIHDTLFMPDGGTARADFPGADAGELWDSIQRILALPPETVLFTGHDYQPKGREPRWQSTVAEQLATNIHLTAVNTKEEFVAFRQARDRTLPVPKLMLLALQVNINGGRLPEPESNGRRYLKFPVDCLPGAVWE